MSDLREQLREYGSFLDESAREIASVGDQRARATGALIHPVIVEDRDVARGLEDSRPERTSDRRWLVGAAAGAAAVLIAVTAFVQGTSDEGIRTHRLPPGPGRGVTTVPAQPATASPGWDALMLSDGATPSTPETGVLVASAWLGPSAGAYYVYADGRVISLDDVTGTPGWVEQRLTPAGVEHVIAGFVSVLKGPDPRRRPLVFRQRGVNRGVPLPEGLDTLPLSLPPSAWADQQVEAYAPTGYAVCLVRRSGPNGSMAPPAPPEALRALPARSAKLLRASPAFDPNGPRRCFAVTTEDARVIATELVEAFGARTRTAESSGRAVYDSTRYGFELEAEVDRPHLRRVGIQFVQLLPDGALGSFSTEDRVLP